MTGQGTPTGIVTNSTSGFLVGGVPAVFIWDSEDGTISGWWTGNKSTITTVRLRALGIRVIHSYRKA